MENITLIILYHFDFMQKFVKKCLLLIFLPYNKCCLSSPVMQLF